MDAERIRAIVHEIGERLEGDWLLIGGGLVALWIEPGRMTEDLDIVGMTGCEDPRFALLQLAEDLGLPVETLNSAADFFVRRIDGWEREVELLHSGSVGRVFRPSATLFLLLKLGRLSAQDLSDCVALLQKVGAESLPLDRARVLAALDGLGTTDDESLSGRRERLQARLVS